MFSNLLFIIEILVAAHMFAFKLKHRNKYLLRLVTSAAICVGFGVVLGLFFVETVFYSFFVYMALFAAAIFALWFVYDEPLVNIFFCGIAAYTTQHFAYQFANLVFTLVYLRDVLLHDLCIGVPHFRQAYPKTRRIGDKKQKYFGVARHLSYAKHRVKLRHVVSW